MLKIPSFILGGILILTGLISYLVQDPSLSIKLTGPWASDAEFVLSDGNQEIMLDFMPSDESAGENVWWIVHKLNEGHAKSVNEDNYARKAGRMEGDPQSFWYASSRGDTFAGLLQESENYSNAGTDNYESIPWPEIDVEESKLRLIYNNMAGTDGPVTLTSNNWENVLNAPDAGESLEFGKSWTAFIPGIIGLILILLAVAADKAPNAKKHIMHVAVLIALLGFLSISKMVFGAFAEMGWWRNEPYMIYEASSLKPTSMLLSSGLLLIYVILCVVSFITARKEMAAQAARDAAKKAAVLKKAAKRIDTPDTDAKSEKKEEISGSNKVAPSDKKPSEQPRKEDSDQSKEESVTKPVKSDSQNKDESSNNEPAKVKSTKEKAANQPVESAPKSTDSSSEPSSETASSTPAKTPAPPQKTKASTQEGIPPSSQQG